MKEGSIFKTSHATVQFWSKYSQNLVPNAIGQKLPCKKDIEELMTLAKSLEVIHWKEAVVRSLICFNFNQDETEYCDKQIRQSTVVIKKITLDGSTDIDKLFKFFQRMLHSDKTSSAHVDNSYLKSYKKLLKFILNEKYLKSYWNELENFKLTVTDTKRDFSDISSIYRKRKRAEELKNLNHYKQQAKTPAIEILKKLFNKGFITELQLDSIYLQQFIERDPNLKSILAMLVDGFDIQNLCEISGEQEKQFDYPLHHILKMDGFLHVYMDAVIM